MNSWRQMRPRGGPWRGGLLAAVVGLSLFGLGRSEGAIAQVLWRPVVPDADVLLSQSFQLAGDGIRLSQLGQTEEAIERVELAAQLAPKSVEVLTILGTLHLQNANYEATVAAFGRARQEDPNNPEILFPLGSALVRQGSYFAALDALERALAIEGENLQGLFDLGNTHLLLGNYDESRAAYERSLEVNPDFWPSVNNIGLVDYQEGNIEAAIARWEETIALDDQIAEPKLALATALFVQGRTEEALALGAEAMLLDASYGEIPTLRENLWGDRLIQDVQALLNTDELRQARNQARLDELPEDTLESLF